jgi:hypothetical protein
LNLDSICFLDNNIHDCQRDLFAVTNLAQRISISANAGSKSENMNKKRENVTAATRHAIKLANELDIELTEWAVEQFQGTSQY